METTATQPNLEWVRPPQQARSQQTLERLLDAAEALIEEQGVESTSVAQLARRAESSVGAFYARFSDKDALMRSVFQRFVQQAEATMQQALVADRWEGAALPVVFSSCIRFLLRMVAERRGLVASLMTVAARDEELSRMLDGLVVRLASTMFQLLDARDELPAGTPPEVVVGMLSGVILSSVEGRFMRPAALPALLADDVFARELTRVSLAYLGHLDTKE